MKTTLVTRIPCTKECLLGIYMGDRVDAGWDARES